MTDVAILILVLFMAWSLLEDVIQRNTTKLHSTQSMQPHLEILNETPDTTMPMMTNIKPCSYRLLLKIIIALQIITLALSVLIYFKL